MGENSGLKISDFLTGNSKTQMKLNILELQIVSPETDLTLPWAPISETKLTSGKR